MKLLAWAAITTVLVGVVLHAYANPQGMYVRKKFEETLLVDEFFENYAIAERFFGDEMDSLDFSKTFIKMDGHTPRTFISISKVSKLQFTIGLFYQIAELLYRMPSNMYIVDPERCIKVDSTTLIEYDPVVRVIPSPKCIHVLGTSPTVENSLFENDYLIRMVLKHLCQIKGYDELLEKPDNFTLLKNQEKHFTALSELISKSLDDELYCTRSTLHTAQSAVAHMKEHKFKYRVPFFSPERWTLTKKESEVSIEYRVSKDLKQDYLARMTKFRPDTSNFDTFVDTNQARIRPLNVIDTTLFNSALVNSDIEVINMQYQTVTSSKLAEDVIYERVFSDVNRGFLRPLQPVTVSQWDRDNVTVTYMFMEDNFFTVMNQYSKGPTHFKEAMNLASHQQLPYTILLARIRNAALSLIHEESCITEYGVLARKGVEHNKKRNAADIVFVHLPSAQESECNFAAEELFTYYIQAIAYRGSQMCSVELTKETEDFCRTERRRYMDRLNFQADHTEISRLLNEFTYDSLKHFLDTFGEHNLAYMHDHLDGRLEMFKQKFELMGPKPKFSIMIPFLIMTDGDRIIHFLDEQLPDILPRENARFSSYKIYSLIYEVEEYEFIEIMARLDDTFSHIYTTIVEGSTVAMYQYNRNYGEYSSLASMQMSKAQQIIPKLFF